MSFEYFIAANRPLPEIKDTTYQKLTVADMIRMDIPATMIPWKELDKHTEILYRVGSVVPKRLYVSHVPNAAKIMSKYSEFRHFYMIDVREMDFAQEMHHYVMSLDPETSLEIWHLWFGYDSEDETIHRIDLARSELLPEDFNVAHNACWCLAIHG
ncbi:hypothetical protein Q5741_15075 [Paenibacillus sp. JX-17]|uniref:Uncharacterized protein n=1 Tax=Paenibacillus lacisoli TaxID=3064525 RepID=A0ABT9CEQ7_9BACL|nr:hypothetical protein [Paenibacillus sp. JX-17]MDO7907732.1 hypothetical protein [Paenibacillus sp. JX-17]